MFSEGYAGRIEIAKRKTMVELFDWLVDENAFKKSGMD
jgi:hypothetical protein